ncbi:hypothetical protein BKH21_06145 [Actinomyces oris]|nr:hypothetical protein BKH21_06145 [Actinomyces oris]
MEIMPPATSRADADHDDTAPTDISSTSTGQAPDTEARETGQGAAGIAQHLLPALPALRIGALLSVIGAVVLFFAWPSGVDTSPIWGVPPVVIAAFWFMTVILRPRPSRFRDPVHGSSIAVIRTAVAVLAMSGIAVFTAWMMWECLSTWSSVLFRTGINTGELVAIAAGTAGLALLSITDILIRMLRAAVLPPEQFRSKRWSRLRRSRRPVQHPEGPRRRTLARAALVLAPSVILAGAAAVPLSRRNEAVQKLAPPSVAKNLPAYPTSLASEPAWVKDIDNVLDIAAGVAGPVIHTADGVMGLNPEDGSVLWSYERPGSTYIEIFGSLPNFIGDRLHRTLAVSPNRRYVAFRLAGPGKTGDGRGIGQPAITIVLDTATGRVAIDHLSDGGALQITDSAIMDGSKIYAIDSGVETWDFDKHKSDSSDQRTTYSGTAGHSTFIVNVEADSEGSQDENSALYGRLYLVSQDDPDQIHTSPPSALMIETPNAICIDGWTAIYRDGAPTSANGSFHQGWAMQAVTLDSLLSEEDSQQQRHDLGRSVGINTTASLTTGKVIMLPGTPSSSARNTFKEHSFNFWEEPHTVSAIFDPSTQKILPMNQSSGLIRAVGISPASTPNSLEARVRVAPMGQGEEASFPIPPGSIFHTPGSPKYNPDMKDIAIALKDSSEVSALHAPGANIIILNPTAQHNESPHTFRLFGLTKGATT